MTCHRRYTFAVSRASKTSDAILEALHRACDRHWWFNSPEVEEHAEGLPAPLGPGHVYQVSFEVSARDQWWAHRRAMDLMEQLLYPQVTPTPVWETLPPHTNRGRYRR